MPKEVEKILYLDADIIVNCDIKELYNIDFEENVIVAVENSDLDNWEYNENIGLNRDNIYINAGVLLIDVKNIMWKMIINITQIYHVVSKTWL